MKTTSSVKHRIRAGARLLIRKKGPSWIRRIDLATLDLSDPNSCVLGQIAGKYKDGLDALGISFMSAKRYGFQRRNCHEPYSLLTEGWLGFIRGEWW